ncbi:ATP-binding protein [Shewanella sp. SR43-4]|uniref:AlbA family DNA-binding domain-containing protein n=1 Tax=Shewanella sp. SR43-4 TaxID=2760942 RepID=UPI0015FC8E28|nr:ATP-binding protein [Shewanella sp. SR43-4]MBB1317009.1 ATP-binding protein [Shewanella sp. SR43-4]
MERELTQMANKFLASYEKLISTSNWPYFYYEWAILLKIREFRFMRSEIFNKSYNYPKVYQALTAIEKSIDLPTEKVYPEYLQIWINDISKLCLDVKINNSKKTINILIKRLSEGGDYSKDVPRYYQLCVDGFNKIGHICKLYPAGCPTITKAADFGASLSAQGGMSSSQNLQKLLDMDVLNLTKKAIKVLNLANQKESKNLEFKSSFAYDVEKKSKNTALKKECTKTIASFLNSQGGTLLVGVDDDGKILGLANDLSYSNNSDDKFVLNFKEAVKNSLGISVSNNVDWSLEEVDVSKKVLIVEVTPSPFPCWHNTNEFFVRNNASSDRVRSKKEYFEYTSSRFEKSGEFQGLS